MQVLTRASEMPSRPRTGRSPRILVAISAAITAAMAAGIAGCATSTAPGPSAEPVAAPETDLPPSSCPSWLAAQQRAEGRLYRVDAAASQVRIHVFRAGRLAKVGHNHVLGVERLDGQVFVPSEGVGRAGVELGFRLDDLVIDSAPWRAALGSEFASTPSAADIAGTRTNLMKAVDGDRFPAISMRSTAVAGAFPTLAVTLAVQWHGRVRTLDVPVRVTRPAEDAPLRAQGSLVLRQSDFGITPFSVLGGLLAIQDALTVDVDVTARPAQACD